MPLAPYLVPPASSFVIVVAGLTVDVGECHVLQDIARQKAWDVAISMPACPLQAYKQYKQTLVQSSSFWHLVIANRSGGKSSY